jgi:Kef-type K+ transport system membrane component KefB
MVQEVLIYISLIIGITAVLTILARVIKQPPIISYLIAGILVGPIFLGFLQPGAAYTEVIKTFAHIGIALLLFIVGLNLDFRIFKDVGGVSILAGLGQISLTVIIGFLIAIGIGLSSITALYLAVALAFSSTVVVIKILSDKREISTLHGKIALGILIVQDFVAALALMIIPVLKDGGANIVLFQILKVIALIFIIFIFSIFILKRLLHYLAKNQEILFLSGIAWALIISTLFAYLGLSLEIGALIAGMSLASSKYTLELGGKIKPLRDFFVILFFVFFGSQLILPITSTLIKNAIIISAFVLLGKPLIIMGFLKTLGYKKRTNFLTGTSLAQISEFSLILILLGFTLYPQLITQEIMSLVVMVSLITIAVSSYGIYYSQGIFNKMSRLLGIFEGKRRRERRYIGKKEKYDIILFGYNRMGYSLLKTLQKIKANFIVVDYDPRVIIDLTKKRVNCIYGDASDKEFINELKLDKVKLVISTIPEEESNLTIKKRMDEVKSKAVFIATSEQILEAIDLYKAGADYVVVPHVLGGENIAETLERYKDRYSTFREEGKNQIKELKKRIRHK